MMTMGDSGMQSFFEHLDHIKRPQVSGERIVFSYGLTMLVYCIYVSICTVESQKSSIAFLGINLDIFMYGIGIMGFAFTFLIAVIFSGFFNKYLKAVNCIFIPIFFVVFLILRYINESVESAWYDGLIRHDKIGRILVLFFVLILCVGYAFGNIELKTNSRFVRCVTGSILSLVYFFLCYFPNYRADTRGGVIHFSAYVTSIIATSDLQPYSGIQYSIYGHYGIIYMPIVNLIKTVFHTDQLTAIQITLALFSAVTIVLAFYIANHFIKDDYIYILCCVTIPLMYIMLNQNGYYYQLLPNRIFMPVLFCAILVWLCRRCDICVIKPKIYVVSMIVLSLAYVWNIESAMVCSVGFVCWLTTSEIYHILDGTNQKLHIKEFISKFIIGIIKGVAISISSIILGIIIIQVYNILTGGEINSIMEIIYPFGSTSYNVFTYLNSPIKTQYSIWLSEVSIFCIIISYFFIWIISDRPSKNFPLLYMTAFVGAGLMVVFINRSYLYNAVLPYPIYAIFLGVIADHYKYNPISIIRAKSIIKSIDWKSIDYRFIIGLIMRVCLTVNAITCLLYAGMSFQSRINGGWESSQLNDYTEYVSSIYKPGETTWIGWVVPLAMSRIGVKPSVYLVDLGDMSVDEKALESLRVDINNYEYVITETHVIKRDMYLDLLSGYEEMESKDFGGDYGIYLYHKRQ